MNDPLLLPLAEASYYCYSDAPATFQNELRTCHVYQSVIGDSINCFAFEGTTDIQEWIVDFMAALIPVHNHPRIGLVHAGFLLDIEPVIDDIVNKLDELGKPPFYLTGHSKGAGEAILAHAILKDRGYPPLATRVFAPPMIGTAMVANFLAGEDIVWVQTWNSHGDDIVTMVPGGPFWSQCGRRLRLQVSDAYDIATKHKMPAILMALRALG
jgi:hypothetical protein